MKRLLFLSMFLLGGFAAVQAQISYAFDNQGTNHTWTVTAAPVGGSTPAVVNIGPGNQAFGNYLGFSYYHQVCF